MNDQKTIIDGDARLSDQVFSELTVHGKADLEDTGVTQKLIVNGSLSADDCAFRDVVVEGQAEIQDSKILGRISVSKSAIFEDSVLQHIEIAGKQVKFEDCKIVSIVMEAAVSRVILEDSIVESDIIFEKEGGIVNFKGFSEIKGMVIGGKIEQ